MATQPQTWTIATTIQSVIQDEVKVAGASPYTAFTPADQSKYGTSNAVYVATPKDIKVTSYPAFCLVIPPQPEQIERRTLSGTAGGGKVWQEQHFKVAHYFDGRLNYYAAWQACMNASDALVPILMRHCGTGWGPTVAAAKILENQGAGYMYDQFADNDYVGWGCVLWIRQEWMVSGGIIE